MLRPLALTLLLSLSLAAEDRVPLTAIPYDSLVLTNGETLQGTIVERLANGAIRFQLAGRQLTVVEKDLIVRIEEHLTLAEAVARRGRQALAANDTADLLRTLRFAQDLAEIPARPAKPGEPATSSATEVRQAAVTVATLALGRAPTPEVAAAAVALHQALGDEDGQLAAAERGLAADPLWTAGYEVQARILEARGDEVRMRSLVDRWLQRQPTAFIANRWKARLAERAGDLRTAADAWRKGWELHQDVPSAIGAIRTALRRGDEAEALRLAKTLAGSGKADAEARAWIGTALAAAGEDAAAAPLLTEAANATGLDPATLDTVRWNLGVLALRQEQDAAARAWFAKTSQAALAAAWLDRAPLPAEIPPGLAAVARDVRIATDLEQRRPTQALQALHGDERPRALLLQRLAEVLRTQGAPEALNAVAASDSLESRRWQAYGHLLANRDQAADTLLKSLPEDDGWALCCRLWLAAQRKDDATVRTLLGRLDQARHLPKAYAERLRQELQAAQDEFAVESFEGERPYPEGWTAVLGTPPLAVLQDRGTLRLEGVTGDQPALLGQAWPAQRLRRIETSITGIQRAAAGVVLLDVARRNGLAAALTSQGPAYRILSVGTWGPWTPFPGDGGTNVGIRLDRGRLSVSAGQGQALEVTAPLGSGPTLLAGVMVQAEGPEPVLATFDHLTVQLAPAATP